MDIKSETDRPDRNSSDITEDLVSKLNKMAKKFENVKNIPTKISPKKNTTDNQDNHPITSNKNSHIIGQETTCRMNKTTVNRIPFQLRWIDHKIDLSSSIVYRIENKDR